MINLRAGSLNHMSEVLQVMVTNDRVRDKVLAELEPSLYIPVRPRQRWRSINVEC